MKWLFTFLINGGLAVRSVYFLSLHVLRDFHITFVRTLTVWFNSVAGTLVKQRLTWLTTKISSWHAPCKN